MDNKSLEEAVVRYNSLDDSFPFICQTPDTVLVYTAALSCASHWFNPQ